MQKDTTPEGARLRIEALRSLPATSRLSQALDLSESVRALSEAGRAARVLQGGAKMSPTPARPGAE